MSDTVLVTGATGTVGAALVDCLADTDLRVRAGVHSPDAGDLPEGVEPVELELTDPGSLAAAFEGIDRAYLLTPLTPRAVSLGGLAEELGLPRSTLQYRLQQAEG